MKFEYKCTVHDQFGTAVAWMATKLIANPDTSDFLLLKPTKRQIVFAFHCTAISRLLKLTHIL
jgi:hypothetical protein